MVSFGATLANLRGFIQSCGSAVVGASTLSASYGCTKLALSDHVKQSLFERFPSFAELALGLGFEPDWAKTSVPYWLIWSVAKS